MIDPLIDTRVLGRYKIVRSLAVGGMGVIYLGRSEGAAGFAKPVVIKRVVSDFAASDAQALEFFVREATILAELRHPGIVSVLDFGESDGAYTMVLEYVHGFHLGQWLRMLQLADEDFPADLAIHIVCRVLEALEHAHHLVKSDGTIVKVVHRDVTPSNVLVDVEGHVKLADFGIARISKSDDEKTQSGLLRGKMPYLAPELLHGKAASVSSDVYSVGVMLHELLLGRNDFRSDVPAETVRLVLHAEPTKVEVMRHDAPRGIDEVLARALAKTPADRFPDAKSLREALRALPIPPVEVLDAALDERVKRDFERIPTALGIEKLAERDAAWREIRVSAPPPTTMRGRSHPPTVSHDGETVRLDEPTRPYGAHGEPATKTSSTAAKTTRRRSKLVVGLGVALALALVAVGLVTARMLASTAPRAPRFIVIENNDDAESDSSADDPGRETSAASLVNDAGGVPRALPSPAAAAVDANREGAVREPTVQSRVTRAFATRRAAIESCFERHSIGVSGAPSIEIHFGLAASGDVESARLAPASLEGTELGRCVLGVARGTRFGEIGQSISFSIPVTAAHASR